MSQFDSILSSMKSEPYPTKKQLLEYTLHVLQNTQKGGSPLEPEDKAAILQYAYGEIETFLSAIPRADSYKEKDLIFTCEDLLLGLIMHLCPSPTEIPQDILAKIQLLTQIIEKERYIETTLDALFKQESIGETEVSHLLSLVTHVEDEYQKGMLYVGLLYYKDQISKLTDSAKACIASHLTAELKRYLAQNHPDTDCIHNLELLADISRDFANDAIINLLYKAMNLGYSNISYFAADALLALSREIPPEITLSLAQDLEYAKLTYTAFVKNGKQALFPAEYSTAEYLAKSDMVHWLTYPTELGHAPDEIEYIGKITYLFKQEVYHVFKYRSDSDTLGENLKNKWLIGWSSEDGGTFSNFDEYALYEKATISATLKNIKKRLIG